jgi:hypothetical protein
LLAGLVPGAYFGQYTRSRLRRFVHAQCRSAIGDDAKTHKKMKKQSSERSNSSSSSISRSPATAAAALNFKNSHSEKNSVFIIAIV